VIEVCGTFAIIDNQRLFTCAEQQPDCGLSCNFRVFPLQPQSLLRQKNGLNLRSMCEHEYLPTLATWRRSRRQYQFQTIAEIALELDILSEM